MDSFDNSMLWQYTELAPFSEKAVLVRNNFDGRLMVKHIAAGENFNVFETLKNISSPYLMRVYDTVYEDDKCVSLCEYIEGITLEKAVETQGTFSAAQVKNIIPALCDGLTVLHKNGIIHRDINPSNVMIDKYGVVKIIDFDIIRTVKDNKNKDTHIMGTPGYASPEQFGFEQTDDKADIYSCGALINYLLTGYLPNETLYQGELTPIIKKCVELDPKNRFANVKELKAALLGKPLPKPKPEINHRRIPGFKRGNKVAEVFTTLFFIFYLYLIIVYVNWYIVGGEFNNAPVTAIRIGLTWFVLVTAIPYLSFGDIGGISRYILPKHPGMGKLILRLIGALSIMIAFALPGLLVNLESATTSY